MDIASFVIGAILGGLLIIILVGRAVVKERDAARRYMNPTSVDELRKRDWYWKASPGLRESLEESIQPWAKG